MVDVAEECLDELGDGDVDLSRSLSTDFDELIQRNEGSIGIFDGIDVKEGGRTRFLMGVHVRFV
jgi:hypothetical protein